MRILWTVSEQNNDDGDRKKLFCRDNLWTPMTSERSNRVVNDSFFAIYAYTHTFSWFFADNSIQLNHFSKSSNSSIGNGMTFSASQCICGHTNVICMIRFIRIDVHLFIQSKVLIRKLNLKIVNICIDHYYVSHDSRFRRTKQYYSRNSHNICGLSAITWMNWIELSENEMAT